MGRSVSAPVPDGGGCSCKPGIYRYTCWYHIEHDSMSSARLSHYVVGVASTVPRRLLWFVWRFAKANSSRKHLNACGGSYIRNMHGPGRNGAMAITKSRASYVENAGRCGSYRHALPAICGYGLTSRHNSNGQDQPMQQGARSLRAAEDAGRRGAASALTPRSVLPGTHEQAPPEYFLCDTAFNSNP